MLTAFARQWRRSGATYTALTVACVAMLASLVTPAQAGAQGELLVDVQGDGQGFVRESDGPWLDGGDLAPGSVVTRDLVLWNTSSAPAALELEVSDLVDRENSCIRPERQVPTEGCEGDGGELSRWLTLDLVERGATGVAAPVLTDLRAGSRVPITLDADEKLPLTLRLEFLPESVNDTMTDSVEFNTRITAYQAGTPSSSSRGLSDDRITAVSGHSTTAAVGAQPGGGTLLTAAVVLPLADASLPLWVVLLDLALVTALVTGLGLAWRRVRTNR